MKRRKQQYEVERIVAQRCCTGTRRKEYRVRWRNWSAADDTWEPAETLQREVPLVVRSFLEHCTMSTSAGKRNRPRERRCRKAASVLAEKQARAQLPSTPYRGLFDLMRRQFCTTSPRDIYQIISESQCLMVLQREDGAVTAGVCCSYDDDANGHVGYLHFLATDVRGQKHGTMLLHAAASFLKRHNVTQIHLDSQLADTEETKSLVRRRNDPVAFYRACGCQEQGQATTALSRTSVPMEGNIDLIIAQCDHILCNSEPEHVHLVVLPALYGGPSKVEADGTATPAELCCSTQDNGVRL